MASDAERSDHEEGNEGQGKSKKSTREMVLDAVRTMNEKNGASLQAIKKFIGEKYAVDMAAAANTGRITKYLKAAAEKGELIRTKGTGASGSFKIPKDDDKKKKTAKNAKKSKETNGQEAGEKSEGDKKNGEAAKKVAKEDGAKKPAPVKKVKEAEAKASQKTDKPEAKKPVAAKKAEPKKSKEVPPTEASEESNSTEDELSEAAPAPAKTAAGTKKKGPPMNVREEPPAKNPKKMGTKVSKVAPPLSESEPEAEVSSSSQGGGESEDEENEAPVVVKAKKATVEEKPKPAKKVPAKKGRPAKK